MITWGLLRQFAVLGAGLVALVGCAGSGSASPTVSPVRPTVVSTAGGPAAGASGPSASASGSTTGSGVDAAWERVPRAARAHTFQGAQAFAEFYIGQINQAWTTPDPELLRPYGLMSCKSCANYVATAAKFSASRQRYAVAPVKVVASTWLPESTTSAALVSVVWAQRSTQIVSVTGKPVRLIGDGKGVSEFELRWQDRSWRVAGIRLEGSA